MSGDFTTPDSNRTDAQANSFAMSIKQSSREAATERVPACWNRERDHPCLCVKTRDGETFLLPYQHFVSAHCATSDGKETLKLLFATYGITMQGRNFAELVLALQDHAVDWIAPMPARYHSLSEDDSVCITHLDIKAVE